MRSTSRSLRFCQKDGNCPITSCRATSRVVLLPAPASLQVKAARKPAAYRDRGAA